MPAQKAQTHTVTHTGTYTQAGQGRHTSFSLIGVRTPQNLPKMQGRYRQSREELCQGEEILGQTLSCPPPQAGRESPPASRKGEGGAAAAAAKPASPSPSTGVACLEEREQREKEGDKEEEDLLPCLFLSKIMG